MTNETPIFIILLQFTISESFVKFTLKTSNDLYQTETDVLWPRNLGLIRIKNLRLIRIRGGIRIRLDYT